LLYRLTRKSSSDFDDRVLDLLVPAIINEGQIIADGNVGDLSRDAMGTNRIFVGIREDAAAVEPALRDLAEVAEVNPLPCNEGCRFEVRGSFDTDLVGAVGRLARDRSWDLIQLNEAVYSLEDTFISLTRRARDRGHGNLRGVA